MAAVETGIPMVLAPCGLDILSYGGRADMLEKTKDRVQYVQDALRVQVRTTADELRQAADVIAERLNRARGQWTFLIPLKGWSSLDQRGPADLRPGRRRRVRRPAEGTARRSQPRQGGRSAPLHARVRAGRGRRVPAAVRGSEGARAGSGMR